MAAFAVNGEAKSWSAVPWPCINETPTDRRNAIFTVLASPAYWPASYYPQGLDQGASCTLTMLLYQWQSQLDSVSQVKMSVSYKKKSDK